MFTCVSASLVVESVSIDQPQSPQSVVLPKAKRFCCPAAVVGAVADVVAPDAPLEEVAVPDDSVEAAAVNNSPVEGVPTAFASEAAAVEGASIVVSTLINALDVLLELKKRNILHKRICGQVHEPLPNHR